MKIFWVLLVIFLSGCVLPTTESDLIGKQRVTEVCHSEDLSTTLEKVVPRINACYNRSSSVPVNLGTGVTTRINSSQQVYEKPTEDSSQVYFIVGDMKYYGLRVKFEEGEATSCATKVTFHTMNFAWERHSSRIQRWLSEPEAGCQTL